MQLRQPQLVGTVDQNRVGGRHVDAAFNDGGGNQNLETLVVKIAHDVFQLVRPHLPVGMAHRHAGQHRAQFLRTKSRKPDSDIFMVRVIGVVVMVSDHDVDLAELS